MRPLRVLVLVTSGFYRIQLWVLMGANVFASLILFTSEQPVPAAVMPLLSILVPGLAVASYFGSVAWLYERPQMGQVFLVLITVSGLLAAGCSQAWAPEAGTLSTILMTADLVTAGLLLGSVLTAMLLVELAPRRKVEGQGVSRDSMACCAPRVASHPLGPTPGRVTGHTHPPVTFGPWSS